MSFNMERGLLLMVAFVRPLVLSNPVIPGSVGQESLTAASRDPLHRLGVGGGAAVDAS